MPTLKQVTCQRIAEVVTLETLFSWTPDDDGEFYVEDTDKVASWNKNKSFHKPTTLPEFIELFKKLGEKKGWSGGLYIGSMGQLVGMKIVGDNWELEPWQYRLLRFVDLAATDWNEAEKYLNSLLT